MVNFHLGQKRETATSVINSSDTGSVLRLGRCNKSNDGCGESNSTVPKNSADEKNCADGAKLCTNETEPSESEKKL
ncbi:hypothetical protein TNCV_1442881 [Trichonephila clavipes]|nr:hypothetical protein TNCV_1442881 [Trichonephila clavipes]